MPGHAAVDPGKSGLGSRGPAILEADVIFDALSRPFEYSSIVFRGDRMRLRFDYDR